MNGELIRIIDSIHREKAIEKETIFQALEGALLSSVRKHFGVGEESDLFVKIDRNTGKIQSNAGLSIEQLGRIAAQTFKQVMIQKFREVERNQVYDDYEAKKGTVIVGSVQRFEGPHMIVSLNKVEAVVPRSEQVPGESYRVGDRIRALVAEVKKKGQKVRVVLSRANGDFVKKLFAAEVPEIQERLVEIRAIAREPGYRTKIAVASINDKVDAVGACVGVRGARIKNIVEELSGEKVDIIRFDTDPQSLLRNALKPAEVSNVLLHAEERRARVVVTKDQLSLAIGKQGQNVRLASKLTHWDIDVVSQEEEAQRIATGGEAFPPKEVARIPEELGADVIAALVGAGLDTPEKVADAGAETLSELPGFDISKAEHVVTHVRQRLREGLGQPLPPRPAQASHGLDHDTVERLQAAGFDTLEKIAEAGVEAIASVPGIDRARAEQILKLVNERLASDAAAQPAEAGEAAPAAEEGEETEEGEAPPAPEASAAESREPAPEPEGQPPS
jgi:N utilization substance protein A